jgi:hypothetical protein
MEAARISPRQGKTALRVARVNGKEFEEAVESDDPPTVTALAERGKKPGLKFDLQGRNPSEFAWATEALGWIRRAAGARGRFGGIGSPEAPIGGIALSGGGREYRRKIPLDNID